MRTGGRTGDRALDRPLLTREGALDKWYAFEAAAKEKALREWCAENGVAVEG